METGCLSRTNIRVEFKRIPGELLIFILCCNPKEISSNTSKGKLQQQYR